MARKKRLVLVLILPMLLVTIGLIVSGVRVRVMGFFRGEAFFDGAPASAWGQELENEDKAQGERPAFDRLQKGGKGALPVLMEIAFQSNFAGREQAQVLLAAQGAAAVPPLVKALEKPSARERQLAAVVLGNMGGKARPAVEPLARLLDDGSEGVRRAVMTALQNIGPEAVEAVPDVILILEGKGEAKDPAWLARAAMFLGQIGPPARNAVPALTACLKHSDKLLAQEACQALAQMENDALPAVSALVEVLQNQQSPIRARAAFALGKIGPAAKIAVPALIEALHEPNNAGLRESSKDALGNMGPSAESAVPALLSTFGRAAPISSIGPAAIPNLIQLLGSPKEEIQSDARYFLEMFRDKAAQSAARSAMLEALEEDEDAAVRRAVADMLGPSWGGARDIVPALFLALQDDEKPVREAACAGICRFHSAAQPYLEQQLRGKNEALRLEAAELFGRLGVQVKSSAPLLVELLKDDKEENPVLRLAVVHALASMGFHPKEALPILIEAIKSSDLAKATLPLLAAHGRAAKGSVPVICTILLRDPDWKIRRQAVLALGRIGVDSETSLPALKNALHDKQATVRAAAALVLGSSGFAPHEIAVLLTELLGDSSREVQAAAIVGLGKIGPAAKAAVPLIHKIARAAEAEKDSEGKNEPDVRVSCITALGAIGRPATEAAPLLLSWLSTAKSANVRTEIIQALGHMEAKEAVKVLEPLVHKEKAAEGVTAALALWHIEKSPVALAFLQEGLKEKTTRMPCIQALGQVGPAAQTAVPALIDILVKGTDLDHRALAAEALGRIGLSARPAIKALAESLRVPHSGMRIHAARALGQFEEDAAAAVPRLLDLLSDPESPQVREAAADALWLIDPDAADSAGI